MHRRVLLFGLAFTLLTTSSISAGVLSERYLKNHALVYGISLDSEDKLSTETRVQKIIESFGESHMSPEVQKLVVKSFVQPDSPEVTAWANASTTTPLVVDTIEAYARIQAQGQVAPYAALSDEVLEFEGYISPFVAAHRVKVPFPSLFDDSLTTYVRAGLKEELSQDDLNRIKTMVLENYRNPDFKVTPTYGLLHAFYVNQTDDVEFVRFVWDNFAFAKTDIPVMAAYAGKNTKLAKLGLELAREAYKACTSGSEAEPPLELVTLSFLRMQMHHSSDVARLAHEIVRKPMSFQSLRSQLLYGLARLGEADTGHTTLRQQIEAEIRALQAVLQAE